MRMLWSSRPTQARRLVYNLRETTECARERMEAVSSNSGCWHEAMDDRYPGAERVIAVRAYTKPNYNIFSHFQSSNSTYCLFFPSLTLFPPALPNNTQHNPKNATTTVPTVPASTHPVFLVSKTGTSIHSTNRPVAFPAAGSTCINRVLGPNSASYPKCTRSNGFAAIFAPSSARHAQKTTGQGTGTRVCDVEDAGR